MFSFLWKHLRGISAIHTQRKRERQRQISTVWMCIWQASRTQIQLHFPKAKKRWDTSNFQHKNILKTQSLKPNTPCSCKQPMQGTKLQKAQFHALMLSEVCQKVIHNATSCCNIVLQWALFIVNKMTTFVNEQQFEENLAQSQS